MEGGLATKSLNWYVDCGGRTVTILSGVFPDLLVTSGLSDIRLCDGLNPTGCRWWGVFIFRCPGEINNAE